MWERGLKQQTSTWVVTCGRVAPHVGAWIETNKTSFFKKTLYVAPHVGAWIETSCTVAAMPHISTSLPMWERGLKHVIQFRHHLLKRSLPMWERGLKQ